MVSKAPTQADIAHLAHVSRATVSYVLSSRAGGPINIAEETRQRVLSVAADIGYEPNAAAQSLRMRSNRSIGVTLFDTSNPHNWQIIRGADAEARANDYTLALTNTAMQADRERESVRELLRRRYDGLILAQAHRDALESEFRILARRRSALVLLGNYDGPTDLDVVMPSHGEGAIHMMKHLLALGHRRIGFVLGVASETLGGERLTAYRQMLAQADIPYDESLVQRCGPAIADGYAAALDLLNRRPAPTAILSINDLLAIGVLHAAAERGLRVPADVSVAGFDDIDMAPYLNPALTTVRVNAEEMGRTAVRLVLDRMGAPDRPPQRISIPARLIARDSTGPAPVAPAQRR
jgi:LacI family transcriptional regulator